MTRTNLKRKARKRESGNGFLATDFHRLTQIIKKGRRLWAMGGSGARAKCQVSKTDPGKVVGCGRDSWIDEWWQAGGGNRNPQLETCTMQLETAMTP